MGEIGVAGFSRTMLKIFARAKHLVLTEFELPNGPPKVLLGIVLDHGTSVSGRVLSERRLPAGSSVSIRELEDPPRYGQLRPGGKVQVDGVKGGPQLLVLSADSGIVEKEVTVPVTGLGRVRFELTKTNGGISGSAVLSTGERLSGALVSLTPRVRNANSAC